jgi:hypothetical protein
MHLLTRLAILSGDVNTRAYMHVKQWNDNKTRCAVRNHGFCSCSFKQVSELSQFWMLFSLSQLLHSLPTYAYTKLTLEIVLLQVCYTHNAGLRAGRLWVRVPALTGNFSLHNRVQTGSGDHPASYPIGTSVMTVDTYLATLRHLKRNFFFITNSD